MIDDDPVKQGRPPSLLARLLAWTRGRAPVGIAEPLPADALVPAAGNEGSAGAEPETAALADAAEDADLGPDAQRVEDLLREQLRHVDAGRGPLRQPWVLGGLFAAAALAGLLLALVIRAYLAPVQAVIEGGGR